MAAINDTRWWSWENVIERAGELGIPHFQRGAVWDLGNRTALLESMYEKSPCGSFVLWAPNDEVNPTRHGVPFRQSFSCDATPLWVVDGQQRIRTMLDTFDQLLTEPLHPAGRGLVREADRSALQPEAWRQNEEEEDTGDDTNDEPDEDRPRAQQFWGVVLPAMDAFNETDSPYFGAHGEKKSVVSSSVFRRYSLRRSRRYSNGKNIPASLHVPVGVIPLAALLSPAGVFHSDETRQTAQQALAGFHTEKPAFHILDELLP